MTMGPKVVAEPVAMLSIANVRITVRYVSAMASRTPKTGCLV